jgi:hypothetical protein
VTSAPLTVIMSVLFLMFPVSWTYCAIS